jgi:hypothetical protein
MILGFKITVAVVGWAAVRDAGLAASPDLDHARYRLHHRAPPYNRLVGPAVLAFGPGHEGPGFTLVSTWTLQAPMANHDGSTRYCYAVHGLGQLTDPDRLLAAARTSLEGNDALHDSFRLAVTRTVPGTKIVELAHLGPSGFGGDYL